MDLGRVALSRDESRTVGQMADELLAEHNGADWETLLRASHRLSHRLPASVLDAFYDMRVGERCEAVIISNLPFNEEALGRTPPTHRAGRDFSVNVAECLHLLLASALGDPIGFESQQEGNFLNHIIPIEEYRHIANASAGYLHDFDFHTEDAFHVFAPDFIGICCLRNREGAVTSLSSVRDCTLTPAQKQLLRQPLFHMGVNALHQNVPEAALSKRPILWGDPDDPYFRINGHMNLDAVADGEARDAARHLLKELERQRHDLVLSSGDAVFIDNMRAAHGRKRYIPAADGYARWLCRIVVARDLRKSREHRKAPASRTIAASIQGFAE